MSVNKGMSGVPTGCSNVARCWNTGLPIGGDPYGNGAAIVLRPCGMDASVSEETLLEQRK